MSRLVLVASSLLALGVLAGCQTTNAPVTVKAECNVFADPGFPVQGKRAKDQRWISRTQEKGIKVCGWPRPVAEKPEPVATVETAPSS